jgi:serine/threonine-protein kinase
MSLEGRSIGNYVVKAKLGEGGMGAVYKGEHPLIGKKVAIKVLRDEYAKNEEVVRRFFNEARAVNDIHHQNIVDIVDFGKMPGDNGGEIAYIIMEFLDGESLADRLRSVGLRVPEVVEVMQQCCWALAASHSKGIIHRDLKPDNIYLCPRGPTKNFVKLLDFGIAKLTGDQNTSNTRTGTVMGTPHYMSPEQCEGNKTIDARSDVYSLGVVMYQLLTGTVPFPGDGFGAIIVAHLTQAPPPLRSIRPQVPPELEAVVLRAMEKDRNNRFQTMDEFAAALGDPAFYGAIQSRASASMPTVMQNTGRGAAIGAPGQRPVTTLSGAASEVSQPVPLMSRNQVGGGGSSRAGLWAVLALLVLGGGGGGFWFLRGQAAPSGAGQPAAQSATAIPAPAAAEKVKIRFVSSPAHAKVTRPDGSLVGTTPVSMEVDRDSGSFDVAINLDGYQVARRSVATDDDREINVTLAAKEVVPPPAPEPKAKPHVASSSHHSKPSKPKGGPALDDGGLLPSTLLK